MPVWGWRDGVVVESAVPVVRFPESAWWLASAYNSSSGDLKPSSGASHPCSHKENFKSFLFRNRVCLCPGLELEFFLTQPLSVSSAGIQVCTALSAPILLLVTALSGLRRAHLLSVSFCLLTTI